MKYLLIICIVVASCSSLRKTVNQQKQEWLKHSLIAIDSSGQKSIDTCSVENSIEWITTTTDSGFDKVTEEEIKEVIDSNVIRREIKRTIKERGQKRVEQTSAVYKKDSSGKQVRELVYVKQLHRQDSSAVTLTNNKDINKTTFMPWWIWLIVAGVFMLGWWKRNNIIDFFT